MAHRRALALGKNRLFDRHRPASPTVTLPLPLAPPNPAATNSRRRYISPPDSSSTAGYGGASFLRRFLHRRAAGQKSPALPEFLSLPIGDKLRERLRRISISGDHTNTLAPPATPTPAEEVVAGESVSGGLGLSVRDAKKVLRVAQVEKVKAVLREIPEAAIPYADFVRICGEACGGDEDRGLEFAKLLDDSGNVIVLGSVVYLRPDQVAKSMEAVLARTVSFPGDPRRRELEEMEREKLKIDERARAQVRGELYCGLGLLALQTLGFMRLTFWELSWDVMEPICFFVTSLHFAGAYAFFLRTATEPSFEGYFRRRFETKQRRLMELHGFDIGKYEELRGACRGSISADRFRALGSEGGSFVGVLDR